MLFLLLERSLNWTWSVRYANIFTQNFIIYLVSNTSSRSESSYFAWSFRQQIESRMILIMLQYDRFWSCFSCQLADTIYYSATSFSFSVSTFLASFGVVPKLKLKRKMSPKSWCPLKVCQINGLQLLQLLTYATEGKLLSLLRHLVSPNMFFCVQQNKKNPEI